MYKHVSIIHNIVLCYLKFAKSADRSVKFGLGLQKFVFKNVRGKIKSLSLLPMPQLPPRIPEKNSFIFCIMTITFYSLKIERLQRAVLLNHCTEKLNNERLNGSLSCLALTAPNFNVPPPQL